MVDNLKNGVERILAYVAGVDEAGLGGIESIASLLSTVAGTLRTADYVDTGADDFRTTMPVQTGTSTITITLADPAVVGREVTRWILKTDATVGRVRVVDKNGAWVGELSFNNDVMGFAPDYSGDGWHQVIPYHRQRRLGAGRYWAPFDGCRAGGSNTTSLLQDVLYAHIIDLKEPRFVDGLGLSLMGTSPTNWQAKCALYQWDPASPADPSGAAKLSADGSVVGNGAGTTAQGALVSTFAAAQLAKHGRAWAVCKVSVTATATNQIACVSEGISPIVGGSDARQLGGFNTDPLKGFSWAAQPFANAFPANLPGSATVVTALIIPQMFPRLP